MKKQQNLGEGFKYHSHEVIVRLLKWRWAVWTWNSNTVQYSSAQTSVRQLHLPISRCYGSLEGVFTGGGGKFLFCFCFSSITWTYPTSKDFIAYTWLADKHSILLENSCNPEERKKAHIIFRYETYYKIKSNTNWKQLLWALPLNITRELHLKIGMLSDGHLIAPEVFIPCPFISTS